MVFNVGEGVQDVGREVGLLAERQDTGELLEGCCCVYKDGCCINRILIFRVYCGGWEVPIFDLLNHVQAGGKGLNCDNGVKGFDLVTVMHM